MNPEMSFTDPTGPQDGFPTPEGPSLPAEAPGGQDSPAVYGCKVERTCGYSECDRKFIPRVQSKDSGRFCCTAHRNLYWRLAGQIGDRVLRGEMAVTGRSQRQSVLEYLQAHANQWVSRPLQQLPFVNMNVMSKLRKRGHDIRCRMVYREDLRKREYQYKLVVKPPLQNT